MGRRLRAGGILWEQHPKIGHPMHSQNGWPAVGCCGCLAVSAVGCCAALFGGFWLGAGLGGRISCRFWRRQNQPSSFPRWRAATDHRGHFERGQRSGFRVQGAALCGAQRTRPGTASTAPLRLGSPRRREQWLQKILARSVLFSFHAFSCLPVDSCFPAWFHGCWRLGCRFGVAGGGGQGVQCGA